MALREPFMQKVVAGTGTISLTAEAGRSLLVKDIQIEGNSASYVTVQIDRTDVGYFRVGGTLGNHLGVPIGAAQHAHDWVTTATAAADQTSFASLANAGGVEVAAKMIGGLAASTTYPRVGALAKAPPSDFCTLLAYLGRLGIFKGYPIPEGKTMVVTPVGGANGRAIITYEVHDGSDQKAESPNGPNSSELVYISYGNAGGNINADGDTVLNTSKNPAGFFAFPFGDDCPANHELEILGILASDFSPKENDGTDSCVTRALRFIRERETMFDPDSVGLRYESIVTTNTGSMDLVAEGYSVGGNWSSVDYRRPLMFPQPLKFSGGTELLVYWNISKANSGQNIGIDEHEVGLICRLKKVR